MRNILLFLVFFAVACTFKNNEDQPSKKAEKAILAEPITAIDQISFEYLNLKDAFIKDNIVKIDSVNTFFEKALTLSKTDTTFYTANKIAIDSITLLSSIIQKSKTIPEKLLAFKDITHPMKTMTAGASTYKLYVQHCPMAGEYSRDEKVYWLSAENKVYNPFYPKTMARCGIVVDTILPKK